MNSLRRVQLRGMYTNGIELVTIEKECMRLMMVVHRVVTAAFILS